MRRRGDGGRVEGTGKDGKNLGTDGRPGGERQSRQKRVTEIIVGTRWKTQGKDGEYLEADGHYHEKDEGRDKTPVVAWVQGARTKRIRGRRIATVARWGTRYENGSVWEVRQRTGIQKPRNRAGRPRKQADIVTRYHNCDL